MHFTQACVASASTGEMHMSWSDLLVAMNIRDEIIHTTCVETPSDAQMLQVKSYKWRGRPCVLTLW